MDYKITRISDELYYIKWFNSPAPGAPSEQAFVIEVQALLDNATTKIYFLSDLRKGRITNIEILRKLGTIAQHANWGGGTSFTNNPLSSLFAHAFVRFAKKSQKSDGIWNSPEEAMQFLEQLKPGITKDITWSEYIDKD